MKDCLWSIKSLVNTPEDPVKYIPSLLPGSISYFDIDDLVRNCGIPVKSINPVSLLSEGDNSEISKNDSGVQLEIRVETNPDKIKSEIIRWFNPR